LSAITFYSQVKLDNTEGLNFSDDYELGSQKMSGILEEMGLYEIVIMGIKLSPRASAVQLITFQLEQ
jgi:hypothetical protein